MRTARRRHDAVSGGQRQPGRQQRCQGREGRHPCIHPRTKKVEECSARTENGGWRSHNTVLSLLQSRLHFILNPDIQLTAGPR